VVRILAREHGEVKGDTEQPVIQTDIRIHLIASVTINTTVVAPDITELVEGAVADPWTACVVIVDTEIAPDATDGAADGGAADPGALRAGATRVPVR
jgi:hypothetical protein